MTAPSNTLASTAQTHAYNRPRKFKLKVGVAIWRFSLVETDPGRFRWEVWDSDTDSQVILFSPTFASRDVALANMMEIMGHALANPEKDD